MRRSLSLAVLLSLTACSGPLKVEKPNCDSFADVAKVGRSSKGNLPAYITTTGGTVYFAGGDYYYGGPLDLAREGEGISTIYIGHANTTPMYDPQRATVTNVYRKIAVGDGLHTPEEIAAGKYWIWGSGDIEIASCESNAVDAIPAPPPPAPGKIGPLEVPYSVSITQPPSYAPGQVR